MEEACNPNTEEEDAEDYKFEASLCYRRKTYLKKSWSIILFLAWARFPRSGHQKILWPPPYSFWGYHVKRPISHTVERAMGQKLNLQFAIL